MRNAKPDIGIFMARPDRTFHLAGGLRQLGFTVVHYNTEAYRDDAIVKVRGSFLAALRHLLWRTDHAFYLTSLSFTPSLCLYVNRVLRRKPYVFNFTGVKWEMFRDRARGKLFARVWERRIYPFLMARIFAGASKIVCNSRFLENYVASQFPRHRHKLLTIYNGVEFDRYSSGRRIEIPGVKPGELTLLCVTALNFENKSKGLELVLDAFEAVREHRSDVKLVVAAKAGIERYAQQARTALASRRCRDSVILLFNRRDVPDLLASSDVFVYATPENSNDSLPRALLEAQSAGVPVVTTGTTGCAEIVLEDKTGFVIPYDSAAMAKRVLQLLNDPDLRRRLGEQAKQWIRCRFTWDQMASAYAEVFLEIAPPSASHSGDARSLERQFT